MSVLKKLIEFDRTLLSMHTEDSLRETPLHLAIRKKNTAAVKVLLNEFHAPVFTRDAKGNTPMHIAVQVKEIPIVKLLVQQAASQTPPEWVSNKKAHLE